ncbi:ferredoxin [Phytoactinopolyspora halotolerans]|uniref:Ferredoxin n=1 Tax=Phytoactinopolyspora halotolerans TaxID=1981512 RepID=A0A6L9SFQ5_9ACTN|nr:ferredoxin [Phytoactinopolyspora halotolerans]NEE03474.1 ferredoxin [Phytoactinopolyspora halotolerans]
MHIVVDTDRCVGGGQCVMAAPEIFDQNDDDGTVVLLRADPPPDASAAVREAARLCPALAITLVEEEQ